MECQNFEPWNSNFVEIPEYYDHKWYENVYDYESETCVHNFNEFVLLQSLRGVTIAELHLLQ